jgi:hypothetical protein
VWISHGSRGACGGGGGGGCGHGGGPAAAPQSPPRRDFREKGVSEAAAEGARRAARGGLLGGERMPAERSKAAYKRRSAAWSAEEGRRLFVNIINAVVRAAYEF